MGWFDVEHSPLVMTAVVVGVWLMVLLARYSSDSSRRSK